MSGYKGKSELDAELFEVYVYLLARALVVRQEKTDLAEDGIDYNVIKYNEVGSADFVNPNLDVAYLEAWIAVDEHTPVVLDVPEIEDRYYTVQLSNEWGDVITNINERSCPDTPSGRFVLHAPGPAPAGVEGVPVELHSRKAKLIGRVEIRDDLEGAKRLQREFTLTAERDPEIAPAIELPDFDNETLIGAEIFDHADELLHNPADPVTSLAGMRQRVDTLRAYISDGAEARQEIAGRIASDVVPRLKKESTTKVVDFRDGWLIARVGGAYGANYHVRAAQNLVGIWANDAREVVYFIGTSDADGQPYEGGKRYRLHFPADSLPSDQVDSYWSLIVVDIPNFRVIPNPIDRYNVNSYSPLEFEADGSPQIDIAPEQAAGRPGANWLPTPENGLFSLTLRLYVPKQAALSGNWVPPPLTVNVSSSP